MAVGRVTVRPIAEEVPGDGREPVQDIAVHLPLRSRSRPQPSGHESASDDARNVEMVVTTPFLQEPNPRVRRAPPLLATRVTCHTLLGCLVRAGHLPGSRTSDCREWRECGARQPHSCVNR
jgi:hypothetical protein